MPPLVVSAMLKGHLKMLRSQNLVPCEHNISPLTLTSPTFFPQVHDDVPPIKIIKTTYLQGTATTIQ